MISLSGSSPATRSKTCGALTSPSIAPVRAPPLAEMLGARIARPLIRNLPEPVDKAIPPNEKPRSAARSRPCARGSPPTSDHSHPLNDRLSLSAESSGPGALLYWWFLSNAPKNIASGSPPILRTSSWIAARVSCSSARVMCSSNSPARTKARSLGVILTGESEVDMGAL
jgi:hypothetical protein